MEAPRIIEADLEDPRHREAVIRLVDTYARDPMGRGRALPADVLEALVPGLRAHPTAFVLLALVREEPAGIAVCFGGFSTFDARTLINIHDLAVLPEHRGRGIGRLLLEAVEARARELGCGRLTLEVKERSHRARGVYRAAGFAGADEGAGAMQTLFLEKRLS